MVQQEPIREDVGQVVYVRQRDQFELKERYRPSQSKPENTITSQHETQKQRVKGRECAESERTFYCSIRQEHREAV
jgi:hypothetical protein